MEGDPPVAINVPPPSALLIAASSLDRNQVQSSAINVPSPSTLLLAASSLPNFASLFVSSAFSASESSPVGSTRRGEHLHARRHSS